jgi:redox-sensitive bicupin YhaK (pirin superfamily)
MIRIRRSADRGHFRNHWLDARFSFSFGDYQDRAFDGYSDLLVLNEDHVAPGGGFAEHGHRDAEVMSYPVSGAVEHRDSLGNVAIMRPNDVHLMRAGRGIRHSEMNASDREPEHHLQWWIRPSAPGLEPSYQRLGVPAAHKHNRWRLLASPTGENGSLVIAQDVRVLAALVDGTTLTYSASAGRRIYLHVVAGQSVVGSESLAAGDAAFIEGERALVTNSQPGAPAEVLLFDLR